ncbi:hypothetical protein HDU99_007027, partial [Rhizoclosmatium hyalinum]
MAPQGIIIGPPIIFPTVYNFTGGAFERVSFNAVDCIDIPQPADLKCLDFSLTDFNYTKPYFEYDAIKDHIVWKDTTACSGDFAQRFNATYGRPVADLSAINAYGNSNSTGFVSRIDFAVVAPGNVPARRGPPSQPPNCRFTYVSSALQFTDLSYFLAENQPVCGPKAPKVNATGYPAYSFGVANTFAEKGGKFGINFNYYSPALDKFLEISDLAAAYSVNVSTVVY